jgi:tRNA modification GTPase
VLVSVFRQPHSYTGEDVLEFSCHGSPYIQQQVLQALFSAGAVSAEPGEFTLRAFLNGKMDLSQAEAVADLIAAENRASHALALKQLRGGYSDEIKKLRDELLQFAALVELELDFSTEDVEFANRSQLEILVGDILKVIQRLRDSFALGNALKNGIPVVIAGKPNAGKSTLLNCILNEEKAIVTSIAGTTRDAIEDELVMNGVAYRFIDTAGLREGQDEVERLGIERSREKIKEADIILYLFDASSMHEHEVISEIKTIRVYAGDEKEIIPVANKIDLSNEALINNFTAIPETVFISAQEKTGIEDLLSRISKWTDQRSHLGDENIVTNARHAEALANASVNLKRVLDGLTSSLPGDLLAIDIRAALSALSAITGEVSSDEVLGAIFGKFCIGK